MESWYYLQKINTTHHLIAFVEVYGDALGYRGTFESVVQIKDFEASARMKVLEDNVQWFEDNSSILPEHKKEKEYLWLVY